MPELLHIPNIEAKPKQIVQLSSWRDAVGLSKFPMQQNALIEILASIKSGKPIPVGYYRVSTGTDTLLEQEGIIHFTSRSRRNTRMQFDTHVLLLEMSRIKRLRTKKRQTRKLLPRKTLISAPAPNALHFPLILMVA